MEILLLEFFYINRYSRRQDNYLIARLNISLVALNCQEIKCDSIGSVRYICNIVKKEIYEKLKFVFSRRVISPITRNQQSSLTSYCVSLKENTISIDQFFFFFFSFFPFPPTNLHLIESTLRVDKIDGLI